MTAPIQSVTVHPGPPPSGTIEVPGDKSLSHRIAMLGALADGESTVRGFLRSDDCLMILKVLAQLGARYDFAGDVLRLTGTGGRFRAPAGVLDLGNSGTGLRLLAGLLAGHPFTTTLTGDESLRSRPMRRIQEPLARMGAQVELTGERGCAPVRIAGGALRAIDYTLPVASAQVKSCVLLAGLYATGTTRVTEPAPTRDHTERLLAAMGLPLRVGGGTIALDGCGPAGPRLPARAWVVPRDFSSAAFWLVAAAARPGAAVTLPGVGLNPRRSALLNVLRRMGADIAVTPAADADACEPLGSIRVTGGVLKGTTVAGSEIPDLIDELPLVAVAGALAEGTTVIRDAAELRVKESDRIASMAANLRLLGVTVRELPDGLEVEGPARLRGGVTVDSYGDHRVPMAMSVLAGAADGPVCMRNTGCVAKSYPEFWDDWRKAGGHAE